MRNLPARTFVTLTAGDGMRSADIQRELAREVLVALRARLELVAAVDPAEVTSPSTVRDSLAFVRTLHRYGFDILEKE